MSSRVLTRVLLCVLAGALCGVTVTCVVVLLDRSGAPPTEEPGPGHVPGGGPAEAGRAREALRTWDEARARAWTTADPAALARLYTAGSVAGRRDVTMLRAWSARGARVTRLTTQVLRLQVLVERERRLVLVVTDRVARVQAEGLTLPQDRPSTRRIRLVRDAVGGGWQVAAVSRELPGRSTPGRS